jgi:activator of HSP90 ATPase
MENIFVVSTRRQAVTGIAFVLGNLAVARPALALQMTMKEAPSSVANASRTSLHQEIDLQAAPQRVFEILLDSKQFAAVTGMAAQIDPKPGDAFTTFGGMIEGRNVEIISGQRIVQAWRPTSWDQGVYSIVHFELKAGGAGTILVLDHTGFPEGDFDHLDPGWYARYWNPLKKFLAAQG